jgi:hypothetical protein
MGFWDKKEFEFKENKVKNSDIYIGYFWKFYRKPRNSMDFRSFRNISKVHKCVTKVARLRMIFQRTLLELFYNISPLRLNLGGSNFPPLLVFFLSFDFLKRYHLRIPIRLADLAFWLNGGGFSKFDLFFIS